MQRFACFYFGASRLVQVVENNYLKSSFKRALATNTKNIDARENLYKTSSAKEQQQTSDGLKNCKVWSTRNPDDVHIAPLGRVQTTTFISTSTEQDSVLTRETTVYTTERQFSIADASIAYSLESEAASKRLAEAEAASAFETFAPETPLTPPAATETLFAPKISSTDVYSTTTSPTAHFESPVPPSTALSESTSQDAIHYETAAKGKVFGGQDTSADTKNHPKENPFNSGEKDVPSPINNESNMREKILHESLKYVHEKGWSMNAIRAGIQACHQSNETEALFFNGYDLVEYFMRDANSKMVDYMNQLATKENIQGNRLLIDGLKYRLQLVIPYADTWEQALAQKGLPPNAKRAWKSLLDLANDVWISIDDTAMDIKWYTKRLSIATIYRSAEIYMLRDQSTDKVETMNFLERHLADYQITGSVRPSVSQSLSDTAQVASGLFTVVRTMTTRR